MSSYEEPIDPQLIEQTKRQIQTLVSEIAQLTKQNIAPGEFYSEFLNRVVTALAAVGGAVWTTTDGGPLSLQYQINIQQTNLPQNEENQKRHGQLIYKAFSSGEGILVPPHSGFGEGEAGNPTDFLLVIAPLRTDLESVGLIEIFQRSEAAPQVQQGYLRFLAQMCELAADYLKSHQLRHYSDRQVLWARLEDFTRAVHASLEPVETAYTIANEGRRLIECDRVSVALRKGNHCKIESVSGQDVFDKRSNTIRLLGRLASAVVATGDPVWYTGDTQDMAPQVEEAVQEYVDEAHSKMIAVLPLGRPKPDQEIDAADRDDAEAPIGALIIEQIEDNRVAPSLSQRVDVVCRHSSTALANAMEHQNLFLMPVWRAIGKSRFLVRARTLPKTISISLAVLIAIVLMIVLPWSFELHSKGTLEPIDRRDIFAGVDGVVCEIPKEIEQGAVVRKGDLLIRLRNTDLEVNQADIEGQKITAREHVNAIQHLLQVANRSEDKSRLYGELAEAKQKLQSLESQTELFKIKMAELEVRSPIDGQVVTWDLHNRLMLRPVQKGQLLLRVANPGGDWHLELHMAEDRMGHIARAELLANVKEKKLPVTYILATEPGSPHQGEVVEIQRSAEVRGEEGNTVLIKVSMNKGDVAEADLLPGASVSAKVYCGSRSLGYVLFHDLIAFVQSRILFRL